MDAKTTHDWEVRTRLRSVSGVSEVNTWGGLSKQFQVVVDPARLEQYGLTLGDVLRAVADNNQSFSGGFIEHHAERYTVRGVGLLTDARGHRARGARRPRRRAGAASATWPPSRSRRACATAPSRATARARSVGGMVIMLKGENARELAGRVKTRMAEIAATLPPGMTHRAVLRPDRGHRPHDGHGHDEPARRQRARRPRAVPVPARRPRLADRRGRDPVSMLVGFIGMRLFGVSANLMSLGAIDFGLIVDGAVVMMENFVRRRVGVERAAGRRRPSRPARHPARPLPQRGRRGGPPGALRRAHHHRRLPADLHARGPRGEDVPADGDHGVLGARRVAAAVAHRRAGRLVVPAAARRPSHRRAAGSSGCATFYVRRARRPHAASAAHDRRRRRRHHRGARLGAVPRHRVHAAARRGLDPHRDAQAAVGVAGRVGRASRRGSSRSCSRPFPRSRRS